MVFPSLLPVINFVADYFATHSFFDSLTHHHRRKCFAVFISTSRDVRVQWVDGLTNGANYQFPNNNHHVHERRMLLSFH